MHASGIYSTSFFYFLIECEGVFAPHHIHHAIATIIYLIFSKYDLHFSCRFMRFLFALNCSWQWLIGHGKRRTGPAPASPPPPPSPPLCWHVCFEPRTRKASHKNISAGKKVTKRCRSCVIPRVLSRFGSVSVASVPLHVAYLFALCGGTGGGRGSDSFENFNIL